MTGRGDAEAVLRAIAERPGDGFDLAGAALALAALERPGIGLDEYRAHLDEIARDVAECGSGEGVGGRLDALNRAIVGRHRYRGDTLTYDDIQNADLTRVIDRRKGLPVTLGILYIHAARAQGWPAAGLNFPGHFLIRLESAGAHLIVDPFHDGRECDAAVMRELIKLAAGLDAELAPAHYEPVSDRDILIRLQNNIKTRHIQGGRIDSAAGAIRTMLLFAPELAALWHEFGALNMRLGNLAAAIDAFEGFIRRSRHDEARDRARSIVRTLRARLN